MTSRVCVDLGCGSGLVAVTAARRGASRVVAADCDPLAQQAAAVNALGNGASVETTGFWSPEKCSTLIFADFLYDEQNLPLLETLGSLAEEVVVMDCRLQTLASPEFSYLGRCDGVGVPDLDPHREFGTLRFWYRGERADCWQKAFEKDAGT